MSTPVAAKPASPTMMKAHPQIKAAVYFAQKQDKPAYDSTFNEDADGLAAFRELTTDPYFAATPPPMLNPSPAEAGSPAPNE